MKVAELERDKEACKLNSEQVRKEFARAFGWYKSKSPYSFNNSEEAILPSWAQIWVHVGSLLNDRDLEDLAEKQKQLRYELTEIKEIIENKIAKQP